MRIVLASRNPGKLAEMQALFAPLGVTLESQANHDVPSPEETGLTFIENAIIKARAISAATGLPAIGDDSGLVVPALGGAPGILSARYAGQHGDDSANNARLVRELDAVEDRSAYFFCTMAFLRHERDPTPLIASAAWHGSIVLDARGTGGFGYDPHFFVPALQCTAAQLDAGRKNAISHRGQASAQLVEQLRDALD